ncbi:MAG: type II toxin-antitoxin system HicB family antitoxin [Nitrospirota bacterium]
MTRALLQVKLPISIKKKEGLFIVCCPPLDLWSQGRTEAEARKNIEEAIKLFIITCIEKGTLDAVMTECGFKLSKAVFKKFPKDHKYVNVPIPFSIPAAAASHA